MSNGNIGNTTPGVFAPLRTSRVALLTSFRRNGQGVGAPVDILVAEGKVYFTTRLSTGKAKRIANNPEVTLAACTRRGKITGPTIDATAHRLEGLAADQAQALLDSSLLHRLLIRFVRLLTRNEPWGVLRGVAHR
jgi:PPOX class probable F420-dependent enzyme